MSEAVADTRRNPSTEFLYANKWRIFGVMMIGWAMSLLDIAIVNIAIPTLESEMSTDVATCGPRATVDELMRLMTDRRIRHVPVLDEGGLVGIVSIGDVVKNRIDELEAERSSLAGYITGERA